MAPPGSGTVPVPPRLRGCGCPPTGLGSTRQKSSWCTRCYTRPYPGKNGCRKNGKNGKISVGKTGKWGMSHLTPPPIGIIYCRWHDSETPLVMFEVIHRFDATFILFLCNFPPFSPVFPRFPPVFPRFSPFFLPFFPFSLPFFPFFPVFPRFSRFSGAYDVPDATPESGTSQPCSQTLGGECAVRSESWRPVYQGGVRAFDVSWSTRCLCAAHNEVHATAWAVAEGRTSAMSHTPTEHVQSGAHKQNTVRTAQTKLKPRPLRGPIDLVPKYIGFQCNAVPRAGMHSKGRGLRGGPRGG